LSLDNNGTLVLNPAHGLNFKPQHNLHCSLIDVSIGRFQQLIEERST